MITDEIKNTPYYKYAVDCINGNIVCCEYVRQASERFIKDFKREDLEFRNDKVKRAINFIGILKHFSGKTNGKNFILEPFQQFIVANLIGWYRKGTDYRRYTSAYIEMGRKNGKTCLIASLAMYYFIADGEAGAEVDMCANNFQQATICFKFIQQFSKQLDPKGKFLKVYRSSIKFDKANSQINVFASNDNAKDGFSASVGIVDEYHSAPNSKMRDVIKSSMGFRTNPMLLTITSAGFDKTLPCYQLRTTCTEILSGLKNDDSLFCVIYGLDDTDDWTNEENFIKANPNLDVTVTKKFLNEQVQSAITNPSDESSTRTKLLGQWLTSTEVWIPDSYILPCMQKIKFEDFKECETYIGVDLSSVSDMTAISYLMCKEDDDKFYFKTDYYLPESCLVESPNRELYKYWVQTNQLHLTPGNTVDYDYIINDIMKNYNRLNIRKISYDSYNSTSWAIKCTELGLPLEPYSQSIANFNKPTKDFEILIRTKKAVIDSNEITMWMFRNVEIKSDWNANTKPVKVHKDKKIDGIISMIESLGSWQTCPHYSGEIFAL